MFGLSKFLRRTSEAAQQAEMSQIGLEFTNLAEAGEGERAVKKFVQLVACQPTWTQFHFEAMDFVVRKGMLGNTLYDPLQDAAENEPSNGELQYILGLFYQSIADLERAIQCYLKTIQLREGDGVAYHNLGSAYYIQGERDKAIEAWRTSIKLDARLAEPHFALALMLENMGKEGEAIRHFEQFIKLAYPGLEGYKNDAMMQIQLIKSRK